ncbi:MAG: hypothetical protein ACLUEN_00105 [Coprococcus sp.]
MSHSQFKKIPISKREKGKNVHVSKWEQISYAMMRQKKRAAERWTVKQMEALEKEQKEQLKTTADRAEKRVT